MVRLCHVCGKTDIVHPELSFHRFPTDDERRNIWFSLVGFNSKHLPRHPEICSEHFNPSDIIMKANGLRYIKRDANPIASLSFFPEPESPKNYNAVAPSSSTQVNLLNKAVANNRVAPSSSTHQVNLLNKAVATNSFRPLDVEQIQSIPAYFIVQHAGPNVNKNFPFIQIMVNNASNAGISSEAVDIKSEPNECVDDDEISLPLPIKEEPDPPSRANKDIICTLKMNSSTDTASENGNESLEPPPKKVRFNVPQNKNSSTDTASENGNESLQPPSKKVRFNVPQNKQLANHFPKIHSSTDTASENGVESFELALKEAVKSNVPQDKHTSEQPSKILPRRLMSIKIKGKIAEMRKDIKRIHQENRRLKPKIDKLTTVLKVLRHTFDVLGVEDAMSKELCDDKQDTDNEDDEPISYSNNLLSPDDTDDDDDPINEDSVTQYCNFNFANQAQITFLKDNDDKKMLSLKRKVEDFADHDVRQSQTIFHLSNTLLDKNKTIERLKCELAALQEKRTSESTSCIIIQ